MKKIGVVTGTRAEFGLLIPFLEKVVNSPHLELLLYVTGIHLLKKFGNTIEEIQKYNFPNVRVIPMYEEFETENNMTYIAKSISLAIPSFAQAFVEDQPDLLVITGDRVEMLAAAIASATLKLPIAHIHGGDVAENAQIDEQIRHALTKFSHLHFTATELSKTRVLQMGEEDWRVYNVGSPDLDYISNFELYTKEELYEQLNLRQLYEQAEELVLCIYHPNISEAEKSGEYMEEILRCLLDLDKHVILLYPNNDPGHQFIIDEIEKVRGNPKFHIFANLDRKTYLSVMQNALFMIGNSSSGIIESAIFHLPVVNIGVRNLNRECSENVINVKNDVDKINEGIQTAISSEFKEFCKTVENKYGNGTAGDQIVTIIENIDINYKLLDKKFVLRGEPPID